MKAIKQISVGDRFFLKDYAEPEAKEEFILAQTSAFKVALIDLESGNRWADPVEVESVAKLSDKEIRLVFYSTDGDSYFVDSQGNKVI